MKRYVRGGYWRLTARWLLDLWIIAGIIGFWVSFLIYEWVVR